MSSNLDLRVLRAMKVGLDSAVGLRVSLAVEEAEIVAALGRLTNGGLVRSSDDGARFVLTPAGAQVADEPGRATTASFGQVHTTVIKFGDHTEPEWRDVGDLVAQAWSSTQSARLELEQQRAAAQAERDRELLVADAEREAVLRSLTAAYGDGRLTEEEHEARAQRVLTARTRGDLEEAVVGLSSRREVAERFGVDARTALLVLAILAVPFMVLGFLLLVRT